MATVTMVLDARLRNLRLHVVLILAGRLQTLALAIGTLLRIHVVMFDLRFVRRGHLAKMAAMFAVRPATAIGLLAARCAIGLGTI